MYRTKVLSYKVGPFILPSLKMTSRQAFSPKKLKKWHGYCLKIGSVTPFNPPLNLDGEYRGVTRRTALSSFAMHMKVLR